LTLARELVFSQVQMVDWLEDQGLPATEIQADDCAACWRVAGGQQINVASGQ
jgi:hypothetical protein